MTFFLKVEGIDPEDLTEEDAHGVADQMYHDLREDYGHEVEAAVPVENREIHERLVSALETDDEHAEESSTHAQRINAQLRMAEEYDDQEGT